MPARTIEQEITHELIKNDVIRKSIHLRTSPNILGDFSVALSKAIADNEFGPFVSPQSVTELRDQNATVFLSRDKMSGVAVWPDGNIGAVFHNKNSRSGTASPELLLTALANGGCKLDCFNGTLARIYGDAGFLPVARVRFDERFAPDGWRAEWGTPDIIFWEHCGDDPLYIAKHYGDYRQIGINEFDKLPLFPSYEEGYAYRDSVIANKSASSLP